VGQQNGRLGPTRPGRAVKPGGQAVALTADDRDVFLGTGGRHGRRLVVNGHLIAPQPLRWQAAMAHSTTLDVRFSELDPYGHVNHAVYVTYFEVARTEALAHCELPLDELAHKGYQFVVTNIAVRFRRAATAGERLTITTEVAQVRRASSIWRQQITRGDELLVTAEVTVGITDRMGKPCKPPNWLFPALQPLLD